MSKLNVEGYLKLMEGISGNLKSEIEELSKKVKQARESENWGTYKNLILAYKEIVKMYNDIAIDVCERDVDKTQHIETTISLDKNTSGIFAKAIEGVISNNSLLTPDGFVRKPKQNDIKTINLFDWYGDYAIDMKDNNLILEADMSSLLSKRLKEGEFKNALINVSGFRGIGKTHQLINFARDNNYIVIVRYNTQGLTNEYKYDEIYLDNNYIRGNKNKNCVVDEGVDIDRVKNELGLNIVTGYINK